MQIAALIDGPSEDLKRFLSAEKYELFSKVLAESNLACIWESSVNNTFESEIKGQRVRFEARARTEKPVRPRVTSFADTLVCRMDFEKDRIRINDIILFLFENINSNLMPSEGMFVQLRCSYM